MHGIPRERRRCHAWRAVNLLASLRHLWPPETVQNLGVLWDRPVVVAGSSG